MKFYLAGPFFNPDQVRVLQAVEAAAKRYGVEFFSPRLECLCPPGAPIEQRQKAFDQNCLGIQTTDFILARIDDFDPGTMWELGYAFAVKGARRSAKAGNAPKIYCYTTVEGRGLNLMLAQSSDGFIQGLTSLEIFLQDMANGRGDREAKKWTKNII